MEFKGVNYYLGRGNETQYNDTYMSSQTCNCTTNFNVNFNFSDKIVSELITSMTDVILQNLEVHREPMLIQAISFDN